jgi:hypothetical protein
MNQALYAHMNNKRKRKKKIKTLPFLPQRSLWSSAYWSDEIEAIYLIETAWRSVIN